MRPLRIEETNLLTKIILETATYSDFTAVSTSPVLLRQLFFGDYLELLTSFGITPSYTSSDTKGILLNDSHPSLYKYSIYPDRYKGISVQCREQDIT